VTTSSDSTVKLWNLDGFSLDRTLKGHRRWVWDCVFSVDAAFLVTASSDATARLWEVCALSPSLRPSWPRLEESRTDVDGFVATRVWHGERAGSLNEGQRPSLSDARAALPRPGVVRRGYPRVLRAPQGGGVLCAQRQCHRGGRGQPVSARVRQCCIPGFGVTMAWLDLQPKQVLVNHSYRCMADTRQVHGADGCLERRQICHPKRARLPSPPPIGLLARSQLNSPLEVVKRESVATLQERAHSTPCPRAPQAV
jgi:hypothetical protein